MVAIFRIPFLRQFFKYACGALLCAFIFVCSKNTAFAQADSFNDCGIIDVQGKERASVVAERVDDDLVGIFFPAPSQFAFVSPVCSIALSRSAEYDADTTVTFTYRYADTPYRPRMAYWDTAEEKWKVLPSLMTRSARTVEAEWRGRGEVVFAVVVDISERYDGIASWYAHARYPSGAATNLFPLGTKVKVTNLANKKSVIVTITSTWSQTDPRRVVDLVSTSFKKIAPLSVGLINARIERLRK